MALPATDNFNRANADPIGGNWTTINQAMKIASNVAAPSNTNNDSGSYWNADSFNNDQYGQIKVTAPGNFNQTGGGPAIRCNATSGGNGYVVFVMAGGSNNVQFSKLVNGSFTSIWQRTATYSAGALCKVSATGTTLTVTYNGSAVGANATDSAHSAGSAGMAYSSINASTTLDDWEGGNVGAAAQDTPELRLGLNQMRQLLAQ